MRAAYDAVYGNLQLAATTKNIGPFDAALAELARLKDATQLARQRVDRAIAIYGLDPDMFQGSEANFFVLNSGFSISVFPFANEVSRGTDPLARAAINQALQLKLDEMTGELNELLSLVSYQMPDESGATSVSFYDFATHDFDFFLTKDVKFIP